MTEVETAGDGGSRTHPADARSAALDRRLQEYEAEGWRVESRTDYEATIAKGEKIHHLRHLLLTLFTGLWGIVWLYLVIARGIKHEVITVDDDGNTIEADA
jgi:hypothetical protein